MNLLSLNNVSFRYGSHSLLDDANLSIADGDLLALVGYNGCGKTTLLKIIAGINIPDSGSIEKIKNLKIAYLPQDVPTNISGSVYDIIASGLDHIGSLLKKYKLLSSNLEKNSSNDSTDQFYKLIHDLNELDAWNYESKILDTARILNLDPDLEVASLSAGLKRRVLLGRELVSNPNLLLLDEPTNHLDIASVIWLENFLKTSGKTIVMVSHDRTFLQNLANRVVEVDRGKLISFNCDFNSFISRRDDYLRAQEKNDAIFDKKLSQEEAWLKQGIKARRTRNEGRVKELLRLRKIRFARRNRVGQLNIKLQDVSLSGEKVMDVKNINLSFNSKNIINNFSTTIFRGDKIGIIGPNGIGKTSLLKSLLGDLKLDSGEVTLGTQLQVAYYDQLREKLNPNITPFSFLGEGSDYVVVYGEKQNVMGYLQNFLFQPEQIHGKIGMLSGGEKNRLMLAKLFTQPANLLVLDEPTNDLDMQTIEMLESLLVSFQGTILLVSHDRSFLNNIVNGVFGFTENGDIIELVGGYDEWDSHLKKIKPPLETPKPIQSTKKYPTKFIQNKSEKFTNKEKWELESIPQKIDDLEKEQSSLAQKLQDVEFLKSNFKELSSINQRLKEIQSEEENLFQRWSHLEERRNLLDNSK